MKEIEYVEIWNGVKFVKCYADGGFAPIPIPDEILSDNNVVLVNSVLDDSTAKTENTSTS